MVVGLFDSVVFSVLAILVVLPIYFLPFYVRHLAFSKGAKNDRI